ncbi:MAG: WG repeat-containing protein [Oscillospiraceae bacterium]|nr:WG repeat-containing protein [Oscillospiraceae bacterium]
MKKLTRVLICTGFLTLLLISWIIVSTSKQAAEKQIILINQATDMMNNEIYIKAAPLLEEAAGYNAAHRDLAETELKRVYLNLIDKKGFSRKYLSLLDKQMNRHDVSANVFIEAAQYHLQNNKIKEALEVLKQGIEITNDENIRVIYERNRYAYEIHRPAFDNVTSVFGRTIQVQIDGKWGICDDTASLIIPCLYDKISNLNEGIAIVKDGSNIYAVDRENNKTAVAGIALDDFGNIADGRVPVFVNGLWQRATDEFELGASLFEDIGMYSNGYAAAKTGGKWGVIDINNKWLIPAQYDGIVLDEMKRCFAQGSLFVRTGSGVNLFTDGAFTGEYYEDAHPFGEEGYAAVKRNGKWGFIDVNGIVIIPFIFDDALSFGQHLAAVKTEEGWGYVCREGKLVIDAVFYQAKSFSNGSAPVLTDRGWQLITLLEYKRGVSL